MAEEFEYKDSSNVSHKVELSQEMFDYTKKAEDLHDTEIKGKPRTFFKDAMIRFTKNKSSIVASVILGLMVALALILPLAIPYDTKSTHPSEQFLAPKLFSAGNGFWDGTRKFNDIPYDETTKSPVIDELVTDAIITKSIKTYQSTTSTPSSIAHGGFLRVGNTSKEVASSVTTAGFSADLSSSDGIVLTYDIESGQEPEDFIDGAYTISLIDEINATTHVLTENSREYGERSIALKDILSEGRNSTYALQVSVPAITETAESVYVKSLVLRNGDSEIFSITDANSALLNNKATFSSEADNNNSLVGATLTVCSFLYDTYEAAYGETTMVLGKSILDGYIAEGLMDYDFNVGITSFVIKSDKCPIVAITAQKNSSGMGIVVQEVTATVSKYRYMGYSRMPVHLFGTDNQGRDLLKYVAQGTRNSLALGVVISIICFAIGIVYGSVEGYFGGAADLIMERIVDILGYIPSIVIITLCVLKFGQNFGVFILAMTLTGWIGTAGLTRTQFYRFKRREYVLASRSLGASDTRLIFKHILPNSLGTIVTSSVLMIPSVIFSEAGISYLGIGLKGMASLGSILSGNQAFINSYTYLLVVPSIILALMMICFNLFGNGLRDALNPSLKGAD
jgi:ABC-type dipeptide/oligopeptide/nickel transport system permease subunit